MRGLRGAVAALVIVPVVLGLASCTGGSSEDEPVDPDPPRPLSSCRHVTFQDIGGPAPAYTRKRLSSFANDDALCGGLWAPHLADDFTAQGVALRDGTVWVSGSDGGGGKGQLYCWVMRLDQRSGDLQREAFGFTDPSGATGRAPCRHGGGLAIDEHGLWLTERVRLWLLDPETLEPRRTWPLQRPVQGSFGVLDDRGQIGIGDFKGRDDRGGRPFLHWFDLDRVLAPETRSLGPEDAAKARRIPDQAQGASWARLGDRKGLWLALSTSRCGVLAGPGGATVGTVPAAEGMALAGQDLWVVSEATSRPWLLDGEGEVVPTLSRLDARRFEEWQGPDCDF